VILGDSITAGINDDGEPTKATYPGLLDRSLRFNGLNVQVTVSALPGVYVDYAIRRFDRMVRRYEPDSVLVLLGTNDACSTVSRARTAPPEFEVGLRSLASMCLQESATPIIASPPPRFDVRNEFPMQQYAGVAHDVARRLGLEFADLFDRFTSTGCPADHFPDGLHPDLDGHVIIADSLTTVLVPHFRET
jgi:lysophospholipase L1-like esterase